MEFLKVSCTGLFNSFRLPDFHTYHKTFPLPPKTTVAGMLGAALGITPKEVNQEWLIPERFKVGIVGNSQAVVKDLWQYRKYTEKHIKGYYDGKEETPWYRAVIVRELLFRSSFILYLTCENNSDLNLLENALKNPAWALSLGREDELIRIDNIDKRAIEPSVDTKNVEFRNTQLPVDVNELKLSPKLSELQNFEKVNLLNYAPSVQKLHKQFSYTGNDRHAIDYSIVSFIGDLPLVGNTEVEYFSDDTCNFMLM